MSTSQSTTATIPVKKTGSTKTRIEWIDIAKGIGIVLVSFGHLRNGDGQSVWLPALDTLISAIYLFHMPLFYFLGGLTFGMRGGFKAFLIRKAKTLLVPYYVFSLYFLAKPIAILAIPSMRSAFQTSHNYGLTHQFVDVLIMGNGLWFLMAFFVAEVMMYGLVSITKNNHVMLTVTGIGLILISYAANGFVSKLPVPFQLWKGIEITGFMALGYVLREWLKALNQRRAAAYATLGFIALCIFAWVALSEQVPASVKWIVLLLAAVTGAFAFTFLCIAIERCGWLAYIGRASLVFYALNALTLNISKYGIFRLLRLNVTNSGFGIQFEGGLIVTALALLLLYFENLFVQKYMPWSIGKTNHE